MIPLSSRLAAVVPSASATVSAAAKQLSSEGRDIVDLGLGEPDFDTPRHIVEAAYAAGLRGDTRYPLTGGELDLRRAVADKLRRDNAVDYEMNEIIVSNGAKQVIFNALMATLEPGNEVVLCAPYFGSYESMTALLGGVSVPVTCAAANGFRLTPAQLEAVITDRTRWIILNHPSNPTGVVYSHAELRDLGDVLDRHPQVNVMSDEIYEHIIFDDRRFISFGDACPELRDRTLIVNGVSKAYAMTGWRIGYGAGPAELITAMTTVQSQATSGACSIAQAAALAALDGPQDHIDVFRQAFEARRNVVAEAVATIDGLSLVLPGGAFYAYIGCDELIGATAPTGAVLGDDTAVSRYLLDAAGVASVPGAAYGMSSFFRLSTASSAATLSDAMVRIGSVVAELVRP